MSRLLSEYYSIPRAVKRDGFPVFHLPSFAGGVPRGVKLVVTVHDLAFLAGPRWFPPVKRIYYRTVFPMIARKAFRIIVDSHFTGREAERLMGIPPDRLRTVYLSHGGPEPEGKGRFGSLLGISGEYALCLCTVEPRKNVEALLEAWRMVREKRSGATLVIIGRWGWGEPGLKRKLKTTEGVLWTGPLENQALVSALAGARMLVYPSVYEGFGLPPLEAAALGVPSVLGPAGALREVYGGVSRFSGEDPCSLALAILEEYGTTPDPARLREFASGFTDGAMAAGTASVYRECLE